MLLRIDNDGVKQDDVVKIPMDTGEQLADRYTKSETDNGFSVKIQTEDTATIYDDASTESNYKLYVDNGDIVLEEI